MYIHVNDYEILLMHIGGLNKNQDHVKNHFPNTIEQELMQMFSTQKINHIITPSPLLVNAAMDSDTGI